MSNTFTVGEKVALVESMAFVGRPPLFIRETFVTRMTAKYLFTKGREWSDGSGKFNPDEKYHIDGRAIGGTNYSIAKL